MNTVKLGKKIIIVFILVLLLINVITIISRVVDGLAVDRGANAFLGLVRLAIIGSILSFLYAGNKVAKWLIVIITFFNGITGLLASLLAIRVSIAIGIMNMAIGIICIVIGIVLIVSNPVNNFLRFQRGEYKDESNCYES